MKRVLLRRSRNSLVWLGLLPLLLALIAYRISSQHVESVGATLATDEFIRKLDDLVSTIQDAETGQRGYLLTGEDRYLAPFLEAKANITNRVAEIGRLAIRNGVSVRQVNDLQKLIAVKMSELDRTIGLRRGGDLSEALAEVKTNRGQEYMTEIRSITAKLKDQQTATFFSRLAQQRKTQAELDAVLGVGVGAAFLLVFLAYRSNTLYAFERDRVEEEIRRLNDRLESRVRERTAELETRTRELEARSNDLQRSNADLMQFAYIASHDLQEPLRMVASYMGLLARRYQGRLDEAADSYIRFAIDGANRMQTLIQDLLSYSTAGTQAVQKTLISSKEVVEQALNDLEASIRENSAIVHHGNLPVVEADEVKLRQVIENLLSNAIKFRKTEVQPEIWISAKQTGAEHVFEVADNGIGFDPKYSDRIFQVFQRLHGIGTYPGNGIGLAICKRIIEHHGGRLWAESAPGAGSKFFFTLPVVSEARRNEPQKSRERHEDISRPVAHA